MVGFYLLVVNCLLQARPRHDNHAHERGERQLHRQDAVDLAQEAESHGHMRLGHIRAVHEIVHD